MAEFVDWSRTLLEALSLVDVAILLARLDAGQ